MSKIEAQPGSLKLQESMGIELDDFLLMERLGQGSMGTVFKARQKSLNRLVAIKVLSPVHAKDQLHVDRFIREARASALLNHPGIVQGISIGEGAGVHYFAMEFLEGETIDSRLKREGSFPLKDVLEIGRQVAIALDHAHGREMVHRDVKPANIMILSGTVSLTVKLLDLGLARSVTGDGALTQMGNVVGTPLYLSPEQARGVSNLTPASDLYSLSAMLFHMASGRPPFEGMTSADIMSKHVKDPPPDIMELMCNLPKPFCDLLRKLLSKRPEDREYSAKVVAEKLGQILAKLEPEKTPQTPFSRDEKIPRLKRRMRRPKTRQPLGWEAVAMLAIVLAMVCLYLWRNQRSSAPSAHNVQSVQVDGE